MNRSAKGYLNDVLRGDQARARKRVRRLVRDTASLRSAYLDVLLPAQHELLHLYESEALDFSTLYTSTLVCQELMNDFADLVFSKRPSGPRVLVTTPPGDLHDIGARMTADLLQLDGFDTTFASMPKSAAEVLGWLGEDEYALLLISVTCSSSLSAARDLVLAVREQRPDVEVLVGGPALERGEGTATLGDLVVRTKAAAAVQRALGLAASKPLRRSA